VEGEGHLTEGEEEKEDGRNLSPSENGVHRGERKQPSKKTEIKLNLTGKTEELLHLKPGSSELYWKSVREKNLQQQRKKGELILKSDWGMKTQGCLESGHPSR